MGADGGANAELVSRARNGDEKAFEQLVASCYPHLFRLVFQIVVNHSDAEEILQETFYRFYLALKRVRDTDPMPFLRQIAVRRAYTFLKGRRNEVSLDDLPEQSAELVLEGKPFDLKEVYEFARSLPAKRRMVFILREILGFEDAEIAKEMGTSETTVRRHAQMARDEFRERFRA